MFDGNWKVEGWMSLRFQSKVSRVEMLNLGGFWKDIETAVQVVGSSQAEKETDGIRISVLHIIIVANDHLPSGFFPHRIPN